MNLLRENKRMWFKLEANFTQASQREKLIKNLLLKEQNFLMVTTKEYEANKALLKKQENLPDKLLKVELISSKLGELMFK